MTRPTTSRSVIGITTGEAGSGKTYVRAARFISDVWLPEHEGTHWSNFPLGVVPADHSSPPAFEGETFVDRIVALVSKRTGRPLSDFQGRVKLIPPDVLAEWEAGKSGPWEFFKGVDINGAHIAIDEIHNYAGPDATPKNRKAWMQWLGEIRHTGATVELISQARAKILMEMRREAGFWLKLKNTETERDPFFGIEMGDWYELKAGWLSGTYDSSFLEESRTDAIGAERKPQERRFYAIDPDYFALYDSYSAPQKGGKKGSGIKRAFQRMGRIRLLAWFCWRNLSKLVWRGGQVSLVLWLTLGGGGRFLLTGLQNRLGEIGRNAMPAGQSAKPTAPQPAPASNGEVKVAAPGSVVEPVTVNAATIIARQHLELEALRSQLASKVRIVSIGEGSIVLADGQTVAIGHKVLIGDLKGVRLVRIMSKERLAIFSDGRVLGLGGLSSVSNAGDSGAKPSTTVDAQSATSGK